MTAATSELTNLTGVEHICGVCTTVFVQDGPDAKCFLVSGVLGACIFSSGSYYKTAVADRWLPCAGGIVPGLKKYRINRERKERRRRRLFVIRVYDIFDHDA